MLAKPFRQTLVVRGFDETLGHCQAWDGAQGPTPEASLFRALNRDIDGWSASLDGCQRALVGVFAYLIALWAVLMYLLRWRRG
jgi:hypothetical protein